MGILRPGKEMGEGNNFLSFKSTQMRYTFHVEYVDCCVGNDCTLITIQILIVLDSWNSEWWAYREDCNVETELTLDDILQGRRTRKLMMWFLITFLQY